jgi:hypothetical protein
MRPRAGKCEPNDGRRTQPKLLILLAGAGGFEPPYGGIKIASRDSGFKANSDSSCCVHVKQHQGVTATVGTADPTKQLLKGENTVAESRYRSARSLASYMKSKDCRLRSTMEAA